MVFGPPEVLPAVFRPATMRRLAVACGWLVAIFGVAGAGNKQVSKTSKHIIGATATITELSSGIEFPARIDTGAASCSLHVEEIKIEDPASKRAGNIGRTIRFLVQHDGEAKWIEAKIADAIRVKSPSLPAGQFDRRYKVPLTLQWGEFRKEVLVTLNDRTHMEYPLLIGRNYLRGDFLVDVEKQDE